MSPQRSLAARLGRATATLLHPAPRPSQSPQGAVARAFQRGSRKFLASFADALRRIGLQISAVLYFVFAVGFAAEGIRSWHHAHLPHHPFSFSQAPASAQIELALALIFVYFGISSLARAHSRPQ